MNNQIFAVGDLARVVTLPSSVTGVAIGDVIRVTKEPMEAGSTVKIRGDYLHKEGWVVLDFEFLEKVEEGEEEQEDLNLAIEQSDCTLQVVYLDPKDLIPHPLNCQIYGKNEPVEDLIDKIKETKKIHPLIVNQKNEIIHGNRRREAAIQLGINKIPVICQHFEDEIAELEALLAHNASRHKSNSQKGAEAKYWLKIEEAKAKKRQKDKTTSKEAKGKTIEKVAERIDVSPTTAHRITKVTQEIEKYKKEGNTEEATKIQMMLDDNVSAAYKYVQKKNKKTPASTQSVPTATKEDLTQETENVIVKEFPYQVGDICRVKAGKSDTHLLRYNGVWGTISEVNNLTASLTVYDNVVTVKPEQLQEIKHTNSHKKSASQIMLQLHQIGSQDDTESVIIDVLQGISNRQLYELTELEAEVIQLFLDRQKVASFPKKHLSIA